MSMPNCVPQSPTWFRRNTLAKQPGGGEKQTVRARALALRGTSEGIHQEQHMLHVKLQSDESIHTQVREGTTFMSAKLSEATEGVANDGRAQVPDVHLLQHSAQRKNAVSI